MYIENAEIGQCVKAGFLNKSGKIIKIKTRKREVVLEYWTCRGNKRNEFIVPFGTIVDVVDKKSIVYGFGEFS